MSMRRCPVASASQSINSVSTSMFTPIWLLRTSDVGVALRQGGVDLDVHRGRLVGVGFQLHDLFGRCAGLAADDYGQSSHPVFGKLSC